jgi:hypothetical protein
MKLYIPCSSNSPVIAIKTKDKDGRQQYHNKMFIPFEEMLSHTFQETRKYTYMTASGGIICIKLQDKNTS